MSRHGGTRYKASHKKQLDPEVYLQTAYIYYNSKLQKMLSTCIIHPPQISCSYVSAHYQTIT